MLAFDVAALTCLMMDGTGVRTPVVDPGAVTMPPIKKIVLWLVVIFLLYAVLTSPTSAAAMLGSAGDIVANGVRNIGQFFDALIRR